MTDKNDLATAVFLTFITVTVFALGLILGNTSGIDFVTQQLCSKQQYDFCEVKEVTYKIKEALK